MSRSFDLNLLPVLVAIHEHGSVTSAAQHLGMSQSAVSTALARLRGKYGDPLFHRVGHGMKATSRMRALIRPLRQALSQVDETLASESVFTPATTQRTFNVSGLKSITGGLSLGDAVWFSGDAADCSSPGAALLPTTAGGGGVGGKSPSS